MGWGGGSEGRTTVGCYRRSFVLSFILCGREFVRVLVELIASCRVALRVLHCVACVSAFVALAPSLTKVRHSQPLRDLLDSPATHHHHA